MKFAGISAATRQRIDLVKWDGIFEKHEGPSDWNWIFRTVEEGEEIEFLTITSGTLRERRLPRLITNLPRTLR